MGRRALTRPLVQLLVVLQNTIRLSSSETGAPSIFQYSLMKSDQGSSEPKRTRSPPIPCFSISTSSQRAPKPIAHEVSV